MKPEKNGRKRIRLGFILVLALLLCVFLEQNVNAAWYNSNWLYRQKITISPTVADADLTNFPYLVKITDLANPVFANAQTDGDDILFTSSDETTKLNHEIEKYDSTNTELWAWVMVPAISSTVNTEIYLYYGNGTAPNQENVSGVWDSNYVMVQHLQETSGTHFDSTLNNNDGTPANGVAQTAVGQVDGADQFDGTDDKVDMADSATLQIVDMTVEAWVYIPDSIPSSYHGIVAHAPSTDNWYGLFNNGDRFHFRWSQGSVRRTDFNGTFSPNQWYYVVGVLDTVADKAFTYQNENLDTTINGPSPPTPTSGPTYIGHTFSSSEFFKGFIDEVRISNTARSEDWIKTSYRNQSSPSTYQTLSPEENDFAPVTFQAATSATADESAGNHAVAVVLSVPSGTTPSPITVDVTDLGGGSATSGKDYSAIGTVTLTFPAGSANGAIQTFNLGVLADTDVEGDETVNLQLNNVTGPGTLGAQTTHTATITDDDFATVAFQVATSATADENAGNHAVAVVLSVPSGTTPSPITVDVTDSGGGSATSGTDYTAVGTVTLTFPAGSANGAIQTFNLSVLADTDVEGDETVDLQIGNVTGTQAILGAQTTHTATITDDDNATVAFQAATSTTADESAGNHAVAVVLSVPSGTTPSPITVDVTDAGGGTATSGTDYTAVGTATLTFPVGSSNGATQTFNLGILSDAFVEGIETV
ncbi:MAG: DUF2341 domain-containing protein, partial [Planctomycetota bacterium]